MAYASALYLLASLCFTVAAVFNIKSDRMGLASINAVSAACFLISSVLVALSR
jgi:hypothetical protein